MTYIVSSGALNSTYSLKAKTHTSSSFVAVARRFLFFLYSVSALYSCSRGFFSDNVTG